MIDFEITTPERVAFRAKAKQVTIPTTEGEITVLPGHVPLVAPIKAGELRVVAEDGKETLMAVSGGFVTVHPGDRLVVLADSAERAEELDLKAIEAAFARAEELMKEHEDDTERFAELQAVMARESARLKVAHRHRSRSPGQHPESAS